MYMYIYIYIYTYTYIQMYGCYYLWGKHYQEHVREELGVSEFPAVVLQVGNLASEDSVMIIIIITIMI